MRSGGAKQHARGLALDSAIDLGQADQRTCDRRTPLRSLRVVGPKTAQQRHASPQRGHECLQFGLGLEKADAAEIANDHAAREVVLQREERDPP